MRLQFPPLGFLLPLFSALTVAIWVTADDDLPKTSAAFPGGAATRQPGGSLTLPPGSDVAYSRTAFAGHPLLAENRTAPVPGEVARDMPATTGSTAAPAELPPPEPPRIEAAGFIKLNGHTRILLRNLDDGSERWAERGDQVGGWKLVEITHIGARFELHGAQITVHLFEDPLP